MTVQTAEISADLPCHRCGYDLRVHPHDGVCPECGASVAESRRVAAIPRRPAWRDSDPRWRRRLLAGGWILAMLPLMNALRVLRWDSAMTIPTIADYKGPITLGSTLLADPNVHLPLLFCIG